jgi:voltage-gated potassium channel
LGVRLPPMATIRYRDLSRSARRRLLAASLLRSAVAVAALLVVYFLAPLDRPLDLVAWIEFGIGLLAFALILAWRIRAILHSDQPRLQAMQTVAVGLPTLLVGFAAAYVIIAANVPDSFTEALSRSDALYFTVSVFATVGFGDIAPRSEAARLVTTIQMLTGLVVVGLIAKVLVGAVRLAERRREDAPPQDGPPGS